jgi:hypothetical protein
VIRAGSGLSTWTFQVELSEAVIKTHGLLITGLSGPTLKRLDIDAINCILMRFI